MGMDFNSVAKSRAKYYSKGAPVQFVQVELLRIQENENVVVTLTFKNIAPRVLNGLTIEFCCKDTQGNVVMQDAFTYGDMQIGEGGFFGGDDAVFVSEVPLSGVEVTLVSAQYGDKEFNIRNCKPTPLPKLRELKPQTAQAVNYILNTDVAMYVPCNVADGWQCTCGAFNYNVGSSANVCQECGIEKAQLVNAVRSALQGNVVVPQQNQYQEQNYLPQDDEYQEESEYGCDDNYSQNYSESYNEQYGDEYTENYGEEYTEGYGENYQEDDAYPVNAYADDGSNMEYTAEYDRFAVEQAPNSQYFEENGETRAIPYQKSEEPVVALMKNETADLLMKIAPLATVGVGALYVVVILLINMLLN